MSDNPIYTIGHSNHGGEHFLSLLSRHGIGVLADVRSVPYSRYNPHFGRTALAAMLKGNGVRYVFLGRELGGRPDDPECFEQGRPSYARMAETGLFRSGISRVVAGSGNHRIALMCAEGDPLRCHRTLLVARALVSEGAHIEHILADGGLESQARAMDRLLSEYGFAPDGDLLGSREDLIARAVALRTGQAASAPRFQSSRNGPT